MHSQLRTALSILIALSSAFWLAACGVQPKSVETPKLTLPTYHVGPFTVRQVNVPRETRYQFELPGFTFDIGATPPYAISRTAWGHKAATVVGHVTCAQRPRWGAVNGPDAVLLCTGTQVQVVVISPSGKMSTYPLPVSLPLELPFNKPPNAYGQLGGSVADEYLFWGVSGNFVPSPYGPGPSYESLGSGVLDMATGQERPAPKRGLMFLSTSDHAYTLAPGPAGYDLLLWIGGSYSDLGPLADPRVDAIDAAGNVWADQPDETNLYVDSLVDEEPGVRQVQWWRIHDSSVPEVGPGYMVYAPAVQTSGGRTVLIFFPLEHRTLRFTGLAYAPRGCCQYFSMHPFGLDELLSLSHGAKTETFLISP